MQAGTNIMNGSSEKQLDWFESQFEIWLKPSELWPNKIEFYLFAIAIQPLALVDRAIAFADRLDTVAKFPNCHLPIDTSWLDQQLENNYK